MRRWASPQAENTGDVLKAQVRLLSPGDEALVRCRVVEHFGDDLMVVIESPRGSTKVQVGAGEIVKVVRASTEGGALGRTGCGIRPP
jgi:hypothetical protein